MNLEKTIYRLSVTCAFLVSLTLSALEQRPNIILILTDDQGYDDYGFVQDKLETPFMDKLALEGVRFDKFYTAPACAPTRAALMTGRDFMRVSTASVGFGAESPHLNEYYLSEALRDGGYKTAMMGKWNLGLADADLPSRRGFDEAWPVVRQDIRSYGRYEHFNPPFFHNGKYAGRENGWQAEIVTDKALKFIAENKQAPFFLYLPYAQPHEPWICPKEFHQKYLDKGLGESYAMFMGMMEHLDTQVGRVMQAVKDEGIAENTVILFLGDNGPTPTTRLLREDEHGYWQNGEFYDLNEKEWAQRNPSGLRSKKATAWENGVRNRLSVYWPAKFKARVSNELSVVMDIYPTLLELAGIEAKSSTPELSGKSLFPLLENAKLEWPQREYFCAETGSPQSTLGSDGYDHRFTKKSLPFSERCSAYYQDDWVVVNDKGTWGLFNLVKDPHQQTNLKKTMPEKFVAMKERYEIKKQDILNDAHAYTPPVQVIGLADQKTAYVEIESMYKTKGKNRVSWANTFFGEVGAEQVLKIDVRTAGKYKVVLRATDAPKGTQFLLKGQGISKDFEIGEGKFHDLGVLSLSKGVQDLSFKLLAINDKKALKKMSFWSLNISKKGK